MKYPLSRTKVEEVKEFRNSLHCIHKNIGSSMYSVYIPVNAPKLDVCCCCDSGGSRSSVNQSEFSKAPALPECHDLGVVHEDVHASLVDDVEVVPLVPLLDDHFTFVCLTREELFENIAHFIILFGCQSKIRGESSVLLSLCCTFFLCAYFILICYGVYPGDKICLTISLKC